MLLIILVGTCAAVHQSSAQCSFPVVILPGDTSICIGDSIQLDAEVLFPSITCNDYAVSSIPFNPVAGSGTPLILGDDQLSDSLSIGFSFDFFCTTHTTFRVSSNGFVKFDNGGGGGGAHGCCAGQTLPNPANPDNLIALFWEDLSPDNGGTIEYFTSGIAPNRILVVNFIGVPHYSGGDNVTGQALLYETSHIIELHIASQPKATGNHTMGIENIDGSVAHPVPAKNGTSWTATNEAWRFTPVVPPALTYLWTPAYGLSNPNIADPLAAPLVDTSYIVAVDSAGCIRHDTIFLRVKPTMVAASSADTAVCPGQPVQLNVSTNYDTALGALTYSWVPAAFLSDPSIRNPMATPHDSIRYAVTVSAFGCSATDSVLLDGDSMLLSATLVDPSCLNAGSIDLMLSGGSAPYSYLWSNATTTQDLINIDTGTYSVTVTDDLGCMDTLLDLRIDSVPTLVLDAAATLVNCLGSTDGSIDLTVTGGSPPYSYNWSNGQMTQDLNGLTTGSYTVSVSDAAGCSDALQIFVGEVDVCCEDIDLNPWNVESDSSQGDWTVSVNGDSVWQDINGEPTFFVSQDTFYNTTVNGYFMVDAGTSDDDFIGFVFGYQSPYASQGHANDDYEFLIFDWKRGDQTYGPYFGAEGFSLNRVNGVFNDPINDFRRHFWGHINQPPKFEVLATQFGAGLGWIPGQVYQFTLNYESNRIRIYIDGALIFDVPGTFPPGGFGFYNYSQADVLYWGFSQPLWAYLEDTTHVTCPSGNDGRIIASASGGNPPYTWQWTNNVNNDTLYGDTASNLIAATWTARLSDAVGCDISYTVVISEPNVPTMLRDSTQTTCSGDADGSATIIASRGLEPFSYLWNDGQTNSTATGLAAGQYYVTITDSSGCLIYDSITVNEPTPIVDSFATVHISCNGGSDGTAAILVSGGVLPYAYSWSSGSTSDSVVNVSAGTYAITITDASACIRIDSVELTEPAAFALIMDSSDVSCSNRSDGSASVAVPGNTGPYVYNWSNGGTFDSIGNLAVGIYSVTVTDTLGCTYIDSIAVSGPPPLFISGSASDVICNGGSDGIAYATVTGGTIPYSYLWSTGQTADTLSGLSPGVYVVTVTDTSGCSDSASVVVNEPAVLTLTTVVTSDYNGQDISVYGASDGQAVAMVSGGTVPYSYQWDSVTGGQTTDTADLLESGTYYVSVTDANGCTTADSVILTEPNPLWVNLAITTDYNGFSVSCFDSLDASIIANAGGGVPPLSYQWDAAAGGGIDTFVTNLGAGTYTISVTDVNGAMVVDTITIIQPAPLTGAAFGYVLYNGYNISCYGTSTGFAEINPVGGVPGYNYAWSNGQATPLATSLSAGSYQVTVTDQNGCALIDSVTMFEPPQLTVVIDSSNVLLCNTSSDGSVIAVASGGVPGYTYNWSDGQTDSNATNLAEGIYIVTVEDINTCKAFDSVTVYAPSTLTVSTTTVDNICNNGSAGMSIASPGGGVGVYSYSWSDGQQTDTAFGLSAGWYTVTVTDSNGCTILDSTLVGEPSAIVLVIDTVPISCIGSADGQATVTPFGGSPPYTVYWFNGNTGNTQNALAAGSYGVTVYDANSCSVTAMVNIGQPDPFRFAFDVDNVLCYGESNGRVEALVSGGNPPYAYNWSNGSTDSFIEGMSVGVYYLTVADQNGCLDSAKVGVSQPDSISIDALKSDPTCPGAENGSGMLFVYGGVPPYSYSWPDGQDQALVDDLGAGSYDVTVTDSNGCQRAYILELFDPDGIVVEFDEPVKEVELGKEINLNPAHNLMHNHVAYEWTPTTGLDCADCASVDAMPYHTTEYTVTVIDETDPGNPCKSQASVEVRVVDVLRVFFPNTFTPNGDGQNDVFSVQGENILNVHLQIYNRLGEKLFESWDQHHGWDGTYKGVMQNPAVYIYNADIRFLNGEEVTRNGSVTLMR